MNLRNQKILITGGASGIGLELARLLIEHNHDIVAG
jgi:short-subunit dehydrogenase involved in D-alanine esterification of teichoic acids